ncbi:MAG: hypothetical protein N6V41_00885, partial [Candidatus Portiera aleyrodidarum]|nr:hypothetical protein [Candidatus Portiera aleyrodidarum]
YLWAPLEANATAAAARDDDTLRAVGQQLASWLVAAPIGCHQNQNQNQNQILAPSPVFRELESFNWM